jgi:hypothetical protein
VPNERLRARGFSAEYFPQFHGNAQIANLSLAILPPRKNPDAAACAPGRQSRCPHFAASSSQRFRKTLELARMTCKYLSLLEARSQSLLSCHNFALALPPFGRKPISEIAQTARMHLKRFGFNAILSAASPTTFHKFASRDPQDRTRHHL